MIKLQFNYTHRDFYEMCLSQMETIPPSETARGISILICEIKSALSHTNAERDFFRLSDGFAFSKPLNYQKSQTSEIRVKGVTFPSEEEEKRHRGIPSPIVFSSSGFKICEAFISSSRQNFQLFSQLEFPSAISPLPDSTPYCNHEKSFYVVIFASFHSLEKNLHSLSAHKGYLVLHCIGMVNYEHFSLTCSIHR